MNESPGVRAAEELAEARQAQANADAQGAGVARAAVAVAVEKATREKRELERALAASTKSVEKLHRAVSHETARQLARHSWH